MSVTPHQRPIRTRALIGPVDLLGSRWREAPSVAWVRDGAGMVGFGVAAAAQFRGEERFSRAQRWVGQWLAQSQVRDSSGVVGAGPVAFASFTFDDDAEGSVVVIPRTLVASRGGSAWRTDVWSPDDSEPPFVATPTGIGDLVTDEATPGIPAARWEEETASAAAFGTAVDEAVKRIAAGELDKAVLARSVVAHFAAPVPVAAVLERLAARYPACWTFHIQGLVGATPELLVRRSRDHVMSRVLAGTVAASGSTATDARSAARLQTSSKDLDEHEYAVRSVAHALAIHCTDLQVPDEPSVLRLANVQHLATDVSGNLADGASALALAASLHPTAAVCGTPTERAQAVIEELEDLQRGRYSGPVGWFDANGDGEFAIALRCAQLSDDLTSAELFAGCGLVADSDSTAELAESAAKLTAMRDALS